MSGVRAPANATRFLIVNADDFGVSEGVNRGIARAHEDGIVTSASFMVRPWAAEAAAGLAAEAAEAARVMLPAAAAAVAVAVHHLFHLASLPRRRPLAQRPPSLSPTSPSGRRPT